MRPFPVGHCRSRGRHAPRALAEDADDPPDDFDSHRHEIAEVGIREAEEVRRLERRHALRRDLGPERRQLPENLSREQPGGDLAPGLEAERALRDDEHRASAASPAFDLLPLAGPYLLEPWCQLREDLVVDLPEDADAAKHPDPVDDLAGTAGPGGLGPSAPCGLTDELLIVGQQGVPLGVGQRLLLGAERVDRTRA